MPPLDPLPVRFKVPGRDTIDHEGVWSISYKVQGLLHLDDETMTLEWAATRRIEGISLTSVKDEVDHSPPGTIAIPRKWVTRAHVRGGWWRPRLQLWARRLDAFDGIPGAAAGTVAFRIHRHDREQARAIAAAIPAARATEAYDEEV